MECKILCSAELSLLIVQQRQWRWGEGHTIITVQPLLQGGRKYYLREGVIWQIQSAVRYLSVMTQLQTHCFFRRIDHSAQPGLGIAQLSCREQIFVLSCKMFKCHDVNCHDQIYFNTCNFLKSFQFLSQTGAHPCTVTSKLQTLKCTRDWVWLPWEIHYQLQGFKTATLFETMIHSNWQQHIFFNIYKIL